jgi:hypothetical protein
VSFLQHSKVENNKHNVVVELNLLVQPNVTGCSTNLFTEQKCLHLELLV